MISLILLLAAQSTSVPQELYDYLKRPDASYSYTVTKVAASQTELALTSQTWHGGAWHHTILYRQPPKVEFSHTAILYITGDGPKKGDLLDLALVTQATGMPVAMLFDIPNQPIDGRKEDDLIAHTFEEYIRNPDPTLPLLFPMVKSAIRAMDAVEDFTRASSNPIKNFVVVGASKRGWTTWLVGAAGDKRVKAIAPMVIDTLNFPVQMKHQLETWGAYSDQIKDYTSRGLQAQMGMPRGHDLGIIVDPYSYRSRIRVPTLIVKGANDPYWTVDALDLYWNGLREPKWLLTVPNAGHTLGNGLMAVETIGAFARSVAGQFTMPKLSWNYGRTGNDCVLTVTSKNPPMNKLTMWVAESDNLDFRPSKYGAESVATTDFHSVVSVNGTPVGTGTAEVRFILPSDKNVAIFGEMRYTVNGKDFSLSTPTKVFHKTSSNAAVRGDR